jgi:hypothetical protein
MQLRFFVKKQKGNLKQKLQESNINEDEAVKFTSWKYIRLSWMQNEELCRQSSKRATENIMH